MSSIRLCWVADGEAARADLWIPASRKRERQSKIIIRNLCLVWIVEQNEQ